MENVELFDMCMCIVFAFQLIRAKEVRIDIEVKRSEEKWREVMTCDVSPVAMFKLNLYIGLCHACNSDKMVDLVLPSHISMVDWIHGFKNPSQETFCLWFRILGAWEGRGPDLGKIHTCSRFLESVPFDMYSETDFGSEKSIGNIFLSVFKSLKFSLQYEILNLEFFCKSMELTMLLLLTILTFTFKLP